MESTHAKVKHQLTIANLQSDNKRIKAELDRKNAIIDSLDNQIEHYIKRIEKTNLELKTFYSQKEQMTFYKQIIEYIIKK